MTLISPRLLTEMLAILVLAAGNMPSWADAAEVRAEPHTRAEWAARLVWPPSLCPPLAPRPDTTGVVVTDINAGRRWVVIECQLLAYQSTHIVYLLTPGHATLLHFVQFDTQRTNAPRRYRSALVTGSLEFDIERAEIRLLRTSRGIGDCGQWLRYEAGNSAPTLIQWRVRECTDRPGLELPPQQWPLRQP